MTEKKWGAREQTQFWGMLCEFLFAAPAACQQQRSDWQSKRDLHYKVNDHLDVWLWGDVLEHFLMKPIMFQYFLLIGSHRILSLPAFIRKHGCRNLGYCHCLLILSTFHKEMRSNGSKHLDRGNARDWLEKKILHGFSEFRGIPEASSTLHGPIQTEFGSDW